jgi:hypothetical protein
MARKSQLSARGNSLIELQEAARERLRHAEALLNSGRFASSIAFGLYALEIELKIAICRRLDLNSLPIVFQTHSHEDLLVYTGLSNKIAQVKRPKAMKSNWDELVQLPGIDELRYSYDPSRNKALARKTLHQLTDKASGVIPWLKKQS